MGNVSFLKNENSCIDFFVGFLIFTGVLFRFLWKLMIYYESFGFKISTMKESVIYFIIVGNIGRF